ncbi:hypothetical protein ACUXD4_000405 [Staphylococcus lugdunensis]|nr:hypothetical protein T979_02434 [Staphylococcus lugdunensis UCIM6116]
MMFSAYQNVDNLEDAYVIEREHIDKQLEFLNELRYQSLRESEQNYDRFIYLKNKMNYSEEANAKMISLIEEFDHEINYRIRSEEMKLEDDKDELKRAYIRQLEKIRGEA